MIANTTPLEDETCNTCEYCVKRGSKNKDKWVCKRIATPDDNFTVPCAIVGRCAQQKKKS